MLIILPCYLCRLWGENVSTIFIFSLDKSSSLHPIFVGVFHLAYTYLFKLTGCECRWSWDKSYCPCSRRWLRGLVLVQIHSTSRRKWLQSSCHRFNWFGREFIWYKHHYKSVTICEATYWLPWKTSGRKKGMCIAFWFYN